MYYSNVMFELNCGQNNQYMPGGGPYPPY